MIALLRILRVSGWWGLRKHLRACTFGAIFPDVVGWSTLSCRETRRLYPVLSSSRKKTIAKKELIQLIPCRVSEAVMAVAR